MNKRAAPAVAGATWVREGLARKVWAAKSRAMTRGWAARSPGTTELRISNCGVENTMNRLIVIVLSTVACANALLAQEPPSINPASSYQLGGVTVMTPSQPGWVLLQSNKSLIAFQKRGEGEVLNARVKTIQTKVFANDEDLLASLEALKVEELSKLKRDSVHFNYVRFKASPCVQYDGIFTGDSSAPRFKYLNFKGYLCRHPESKDLVVQIEFSNHSNRRALSANLVDLSDEFFEKMTFSKV